MSEQSEPRKSRIPDFSNVDEEAEFWDTHDTTEFEDEFKPVQVRFAKNLSEGFKVRFDPETARKIREYAHEQGIGPTTLIRMWILEHLRELELVGSLKPLLSTLQREGIWLPDDKVRDLLLKFGEVE